MDLVRERKHSIPKAAYGVAGIAVLVALVAWALNSLAHQQTGTFVDKATIVTDTAIRGTLVRSVSAQGAFAPEHLRVSSATQPGVVNALDVKPGSIVQPGAVIAQMQNPSLEAAAANARSALLVAQANLADARQQAQAAIIAQQSTFADARSQAQSDALKAASYRQLYKQGLLPTLQYQQARIQAQQSANDVRSRYTQVVVAKADGDAKIAAARAQVAQAAAALQAARASVDALTVRAATSGIVQSVDVEPGTSVAQNAEIARIADMRDLKAVLQVAEADVHAVVPGMLAHIDTGNGVIDGRVSRIAPAAQNGTVAVDVTFARTLQSSARPDATVTGMIVIASVPNAVSIARPAGAADNSTIDVFKVADGGSRAVRVRVRLGQGSSDRVQILSGIAPVDTVIVSDTSNYTGQAVLLLH